MAPESGRSAEGGVRGEQLADQLGLALEAGVQRRDDARAELGAGLAIDLREGVAERPTGPGGPGGGHGIERVGDRQDAGGQRDLLAGQTVRIAAAREALVVAA